MLAYPTTGIIIYEVCIAIVESLLHRYVKTPVGAEAANIIAGFEEKWRFPQCFGAVDGSHFLYYPLVTAPHIIIIERDSTYLCWKL